ncbi:MAG: hypothetical protein WBM17_12800 [Anaerolineales bacterium]
MKRLFLLALILAALMLACNVPGQETPAPATNQPPAATETPAITQTPTVAITPTIQTNVQCNELEFYLDPALASGSNCETVPENIENDPFQLPEYTQVTLQGYVLPPDQPYFQTIHVYRLAEFLALRPQASTGVDALKALIAGGAPGADALPVMDLLGAAQEFHAQYKVVSFANGSGIRFVSQYAQYYAPINNHDMFLIFQGLTSDEQYYVSAILRISNPILPANADNPPGGLSWEAFGNQFDTYIVDITNQLNAQPEASFVPGIPLLDALIQSITITP